jgi:hypothetical protein
MSEERQHRQYGQKDEKQEKQQEKEEKSWEEKWRRDPLSAAVWAIILIWLGLVLLAANFDLFEDTWLDIWPIFFTGAGGILLLEIIFRLAVPAYRQPLIGTAILAIVFLSIGLGGLINWNLVWAVALIGIGAFILLRGLLGQK